MNEVIAPRSQNLTKKDIRNILSSFVNTHKYPPPSPDDIIAIVFKISFKQILVYPSINICSYFKYCS